MDKNLIQAVINSLEQDGAIQGFLAATEQQRVDIALAYAMAEGKKIEAFQNTYLTNDAACQSFRANVLTLCTSGR